MRITNHYKETVHWRAFLENDTMYAIGLKEGAVKRGQTGTWRDDSYARFKVEIKTGGIIRGVTGVLAPAGRQFDMSDDLLVTDAGELTVAEVMLVTDRDPHTEQRSHVLFVDLRDSSGQAERSMSSTFETAFANTEGFERSSTDEQTWTVEGRVGGMVGKKGVASGSAGLSAGFQKKVVHSLVTDLKQTVTTVWSSAWNDTLVLAGGKLHVIEVVWTVTLDRGTVMYFGEKTTFSVVRSATPSLLDKSEYDSHEDLPPAYLEKWMKLPHSRASRDP